MGCVWVQTACDRDRRVNSLMPSHIWAKQNSSRHNFGLQLLHDAHITFCIWKEFEKNKCSNHKDRTWQNFQRWWSKQSEAPHKREQGVGLWVGLLNRPSRSIDYEYMQSSMQLASRSCRTPYPLAKMTTFIKTDGPHQYLISINTNTSLFHESPDFPASIWQQPYQHQTAQPLHWSRDWCWGMTTSQLKAWLLPSSCPGMHPLKTHC